MTYWSGFSFWRSVASPQTTREPDSAAVTTPPCAVGHAVQPDMPMTELVVPSLNHNVPSTDASYTTPSSVASMNATGLLASIVSSPMCTVLPLAYTRGRVPLDCGAGFGSTT